MRIGVFGGLSLMKCAIGGVVVALSLSVPSPSTLASEAARAPLTSVDPLKIPADYMSIGVVDSDVFDDAGEKIGKITALILTPSNQAIFAILSVGAFLGISEKLVIVRTSALKLADGKSVLVGGTRASLTALPSYARAE